MKALSILPIAALTTTLLLSACGGSGSSGSAGTPATPTAPTVTLAAAANQTLAGGKALPLSASVSDSSAVTWTLAAGSVGTLSASSGASITYTPPATVTANTNVTVNASAGGVSKSVTLTVFADPGSPGLSIVSGRLNSDLVDPTTDGPVATARFRDSLAVAADPAGNLYVAGSCRFPSRLMGLTLRKISTAGSVSTLASCGDNSWFGASDSAGNLQKIYLPNGLAADRAGNLYTGTYFFSTSAGSASNDSRAVYKISPQGTLTLLAGAAGSHTADLKDGNGAAARFLTPSVIGLDSDENLYVADKDNTVLRKINAAADVTTVSALPASVNADLNGNTYRLDSTAGTIIRTTPAGADSVVADVHTLPGVLSTMTGLRPFGLVRTGPATYALLVSNGYYFSNEVVVQLVVAH
jgi:sugar lactone lactonase YvrE